jgi:hypothetical protein
MIFLRFCSAGSLSYKYHKNRTRASLRTASAKDIDYIKPQRHSYFDTLTLPKGTIDLLLHIAPLFRPEILDSILKKRIRNNNNK